MVQAAGYGDGDDWDADEELELIDGEERLPWLESGDEEDEAAGAFDTSRALLLGLLAVVVLGALAAAIWYFTGRGGDEPVADGSLIEAPDEPWKTRPEDEGGKTFAGTGDTSFAVGEGKTREGRLASKPVRVEEPAVAGPQIASTLNAPEEPAKPSGVGVQVGAYARRAQAQEGWQTLMRQTEALNGVRHRIVEGQADIGRVFRLQAIAPNREAANKLCADLKADGLACQVK